MTHEEIIAMAKEAGGYASPHYPENLVMDVHDLARFAALVAAKEREACCDPVITNSADICAADMPHVVVQKYQAAIRARGQKEGA